MKKDELVAAAVGAGPGNGAALAWRFVEADYATAFLSRRRSTVGIESELTDTGGFECDIGDPMSVESAFARIRSQLGEVDVLLYDAGSGVFADMLSATNGRSLSGHVSGGVLVLETPSLIFKTRHPAAVAGVGIFTGSSAMVGARAADAMLATMTCG
jgi:NAD(P)-dependent dehydrogenase (short-subunit alcohol dehydrogenase family)